MTDHSEVSRLTLKQHPLSAKWRSMPEEAFAAFVDDIKKYGQREPGVMYEGMVLDGWHRYRACVEAGIGFLSAEFDGDDPAALVISKNKHRRHETAGQIAVSVAECLEWRPRGGDQTATIAVRSGATVKGVAEAAGVSERTMAQAKAAIKAGLGDAVKTGAISVARAAEIAKLPKAKREKALTQQPAKKADPRDAEIKRLTAALEEANESKSDLADICREQEDKLTAFETTDPDEQQKEIQKLQKRVVRLEAEVERLTVARNDCQNKNNELIRQVKMLQRKSGGK